jgi:hypothetical protein
MNSIIRKGTKIDFMLPIKEKRKNSHIIDNYCNI